MPPAARHPVREKTAAGHTVAVEPVKAAAPKFTWQRYRKLIVGVLGLAASLLAQGLIPAPYAHYVAAGLAAMTAAGIYTAKNAPTEQGSEAGASSLGVVLFVVVVLIILAGGFALNHWLLLLLILALLLLFRQQIT